MSIARSRARCLRYRTREDTMPPHVAVVCHNRYMLRLFVSHDCHYYYLLLLLILLLLILLLLFIIITLHIIIIDIIITLILLLHYY
jgi:hypothetical protein